MSKPPRTSAGTRLSTKASAWLGAERECDQCNDLKIISQQTYTPNNKGRGGWSETCKVCEALGASGSLSARQSVMKKPEELTSTHTADMIAEMYLQGMMARPDQEKLAEIVTTLQERVRTLPRRESLFLFIEIVKPLVAGWMEPGPIHEDILDGLLSNHRRRLVIATRYSAKSTLTSIYVAWRIFREPLMKIMVVSRGAKLAARMLRTVRQVFIGQCPMLAHLVPTDECLDNAEQFQIPDAVRVTTGGATLTSLGLGSNLPGFRSDLTVGDDIEGPQEDTPEKVQDLREGLNELHMINPKGEKVMLGTYQSEFSIYAVLAEEEAADGTRIWEEHRACMFEDDGEMITSRWPAMFTDDDAMDWRKSVTERAWKLHAMLIADPSILHERPLKIGQLRVVDYDPMAREFYVDLPIEIVPRPDLPKWGAPKGDEWMGLGYPEGIRAPYVKTTVAIDPASGLAGRDAIGVSVLGITRAGYGVIRHLEGVRGPDKLGNIRRCAQIVIDYGGTELVVEELADGLFGETLQNQLVEMGLAMMVDKVTTGGQQKGRRIIETLQPPMANGRIVILEKVVKSDHGGEFVQQMIRISYDGRTGKSKDHDDIVDSLAHGVAKNKGDLVSDVSDNITQHTLASLDNLRGLPVKYGGLGAHGDTVGARVIGMGSGLEDEMPLAERLMEEDQVLVEYETRLDHYQELMAADRQAGRIITPARIEQCARIRTVINDLKRMQVL